MLIKSSEYKASYVEVEKCPDVPIPEFAFIGRSNVGKSALINYLCGRKALSKVSNTPGKTSTINYFEINGKFHLVDLPGYSYAKVSKEKRNQWNNMIRNYILKRKQLQYVCLLIDSRIPPQKVDLGFLQWMANNSVPFIIIFTKADKPGSKEVSTNVQTFQNTLLKSWEELPPMFISSAERNVGREDVWNFIGKAVEEYDPLIGLT
ncbi:MAG: ribosome biosis GTP-binding protein YsxC/EngB [Bacteroidota bacterium]|nr:ribosome biosis GTP-binding protein YsxC/EngB [Bacteroidota bacterium]